jgi:intracellular septation protein
VAIETISWRRRHFPFNAAQTVNIVGEIGPLFAMFLVNGISGIVAGTWALIFSTVLSLGVTLWVLGRPPVMPFIAGAVTLFNALVAFVLWLGLRSGRNFFRFVFGNTFHYTDEGWYKLTRNVALFFLVTAFVNEAIRLGFAHTHFFALNRDFTGLDIWILFKIFGIMPATALFFWWQVRLLQRYRLPEPVAKIAPRGE